MTAAVQVAATATAVPTAVLTAQPPTVARISVQPTQIVTQAVSAPTTRPCLLIVDTASVKVTLVAQFRLEAERRGPTLFLAFLSMSPGPRDCVVFLKLERLLALIKGQTLRLNAV